MIPQSIYCPKCGQKVEKAEIVEDSVIAGILTQGYNDGARFICPCGVIAILLNQELPKSPTFSLLFDVVKIKERSN